MQFASLYLTVNHKPGVMSHICALYAQYGYNLEGVLATRNSDGSTATVWLMVKEDSKMHSLVEQMQKIPDILDVRVEKADENAFDKCAACLSEPRNPQA